MLNKLQISKHCSKPKDADSIVGTHNSNEMLCMLCMQHLLRRAAVVGLVLVFGSLNEEVELLRVVTVRRNVDVLVSEVASVRALEPTALTGVIDCRTADHLRTKNPIEVVVEVELVAVQSTNITKDHR